MSFSHLIKWLTNTGSNEIQSLLLIITQKYISQREKSFVLTKRLIVGCWVSGLIGVILHTFPLQRLYYIPPTKFLHKTWCFFVCMVINLPLKFQTCGKKKKSTMYIIFNFLVVLFL